MFSKLTGVTAAIAVGASVTVAGAQNAAVQWRVEDGGNGHWYAINDDYLFWHESRNAALARGGDLVSIETNDEWYWIRSWLPPILHGYSLGGYQISQSATPDTGWKWLTGGDVQRNWMVMDDNPCGASPAGVEDNQQDYLHTCCDENGWADIDEGGWGCDLRFRSIVEWSKDCNHDGVVDYGQILVGSLSDSNLNGVPDCCESSIPCSTCVQIDLNLNGAIDGADLGVLLAFWGPMSPAFPRADINGDGRVDGADLGVLLANWGPCPQ